MNLRRALPGWLALAALALLCLAPAAESGTSAKARVRLSERCGFEPLAGNGLTLKSQITLQNIGPVPARVKLTPGWTIKDLYPKAKTSHTVRLAVGQTTTLSVKRTIPHAPELRTALEPPTSFDCASVFVVSDA